MVDNPEALADAAAQWVHDRAWEVASARGRFTLALSGGNTPRALYTRLAAGPAPLGADGDLLRGRAHRFRPTSPDSNYRMVKETLLRAPGLSRSGCTGSAASCPRRGGPDYEQTLRKLFPAAATLPALRPDAPRARDRTGTPPRSSTTRRRWRRSEAWVIANWVEQLGRHRLSFTYPVLDAAAEVLFLVAGADKEWALHEVLRAVPRCEDVPARGVRPPRARVTFLVDRAAAAGLGQMSA